MLQVKINDKINARTWREEWKMKDKNYRLSAELCALKAEDADKLIAAGDGDAALLYI